MDFVKDLGRKRENKRTNQIENVEIAENYNLLVEKYNELNAFSEDVVEKHNAILEKYNKQLENLQDISKSNEISKNELREQKEITGKIEQKFNELERHVDSLLESYQGLEKENKRQEEIIKSLEKYIEIMDKSSKTPIKNERGAGRKKKYSDEQINRILGLKDNEMDYIEIVNIMNQEFSTKKWDVKEIKYVYTRYKN